MDRLQETKERLSRVSQTHLLDGTEKLGAAARESLLDQIQSLPLEELAGMMAETSAHHSRDLSTLAPPNVIHHDAPGSREFREAGEQMIRRGQVAAFTVAGGQGTRLGWRGPKGTYPATVVTGKPLFRVFAEQLLATERRFSVRIPWFIMTSPLNDDDTQAFFADNNFFGRPKQEHVFIPQGVVPCTDEEGRVLLAAPGEVATNPDGHGGAIRALHHSGALKEMAARGITQLSYFQVDNPLVRVVDPIFLGAHVHAPGSSGEMSSKCIPKRNAAEKVGVLCLTPTPAGNRTTVIEYSDLPSAMAHQRDEKGELAFGAANIAVHVISVEFAQRLAASSDIKLPWHRAHKKVPSFDAATGARILPDKPNAFKFECFIFDALPLARNSVTLQTSRMEEFAPIKNAEGEDSPASSHRIQSDRNGAWLEAVGVTIPKRTDGSVDAKIEIGPLAALEAADLRNRITVRTIRRGEEFVI
ncbi:MAG: UTP--glucose-1-phosphate uridylyltransferase [Planctomycetes bacterium]|nr:UTP--glucose-1-phosphate uridylyltransferase [Planctomycetota bacterium]